jgi:hypothetical protein
LAKNTFYFLDFLRKASVIEAMENHEREALRQKWQATFGWLPPSTIRSSFLKRNLHYQEQVRIYGPLRKTALRQLQDIARKLSDNPRYVPSSTNNLYKPDTRLIRTYKGVPHQVIICEGGFMYEGRCYKSLSAIARHITGTSWNGHTFFGLKGKTAHG